MSAEDFRLRVEGKITAEEYVNRIDERIRLRNQDEAIHIKRCPRCGKPGGLIYCPSCHSPKR